MYRDYLAPEYIKNTLHTDWLPGFRWIPRIWSFYGFDMPPTQVAGTVAVKPHLVEPGYPLAPDAVIHHGETTDYVMSPDPVPEDGQWTLQTVYFKGYRIPCFFAFKKMVFGKYLYFNVGLKPDMNYNESGVKNWNWSFPECSLTWTKGGTWA